MRREHMDPIELRLDERQDAPRARTSRLATLTGVVLASVLVASCGFLFPSSTPDGAVSGTEAATASAADATPTQIVEAAAGGAPGAPTTSKPGNGSSNGSANASPGPTASAASTSSATTTTGPTQTAPDVSLKVNSIDTIVGDMSLENDSRLDGIPNFLWATGPNPAAVLMGADPRGSKMQSWWLNLSSVWSQYKDADLWSAYVQWFLIFEGAGNGANNVRVEVRNPRTYYLSRSTGQWNAIGGLRPGSHWFQAWKSDLTWANDNVDLRRNADGSVAVKVPLNSPNVMHGIWEQGKLDIANIVTDVGALFVTVQARLVVDDPSRPDDRAAANLLMHVGGDYYPDMTATAANSFPPSAGLSRAKRITSDWRSFNFATLDVARQDYTGPTASIPTSLLRSNPPPLE
ncbi:MAG: hypothetical protein RJA99_37 [Pseudomonadota bacterium]